MFYILQNNIRKNYYSYISFHRFKVEISVIPNFDTNEKKRKKLSVCSTRNDVKMQMKAFSGNPQVHELLMFDVFVCDMLLCIVYCIIVLISHHCAECGVWNVNRLFCNIVKYSQSRFDSNF